MSSTLSTEISSGMLSINSLGDRNLCSMTSSLSLHFSFMSFSIASSSSLLLVSIKTWPFRRVLRVFIPTLILEGFILAFSTPLIDSGVEALLI